jgi:hypothetical protein
MADPAAFICSIMAYNIIWRCCGILEIAGLAAGATTVVPAFTSVGQAVATLPELSLLNSQVSKVSLATQLNSADFVGTVFAPVNSVSLLSCSSMLLC